MSDKYLLKLILGAALLLPFPVFAAASITEVMYDVPGSDTAREWIEMQNTGPAPLDVSTLKLFESGVNHKIIPQASAVLPPGGYALIAANADKFLVDWPGYSGPLFHSSFSLSNTGETLVLKDASSTELASITYPSGTAEGDGNSLNLTDGSWSARKPSPGAPASSEVIPPPAPKQAVSNAKPSSGVSTGNSAAPSRAASSQAGDMLASAATAVPDSHEGQSFGIMPWLLALGGIVLIAGAALFLGKKQKPGTGYTIIEEKP